MLYLHFEYIFTFVEKYNIFVTHCPGIIVNILLTGKTELPGTVPQPISSIKPLIIALLLNWG